MRPPLPAKWVARAPDLLAIASRCEAAKTSEQHVLLSEAYRAVFGGPECNPINHWPGYSSPRWDRFHVMLNAGAYESAALTLVPEGWTYLIDNTDGKEIVELYPYGPTFPVQRGSHLLSPALALCAAALRAKSSCADPLVGKGEE